MTLLPTTELILWERGLIDDAVQSLLTPTTTLLNLGRSVGGARRAKHRS